MTPETFKLEDLNCYEIHLHEDENGDSDSFEVWAIYYDTDSLDYMFYIKHACVAQIRKRLVKNVEET